ncbi:hypothetical protein DXG01_011997 [Tephrocybe rancida]|nr:hypothetical protein DXG01_011997 [Tephrocybe rancida]
MASGLVVQEASSPVLFKGLTLTNAPLEILNHTLPFYISIASAVGLFIHVLVASRLTRPVLLRLGLVKKNDVDLQENNEGRVAAHGGSVIFAAEALTLIGSLELLRGYSSFLALFAILYPRSTIASNHITCVLASSWIVYFIRDVVPLTTYTDLPADPSYMLWYLIGVLSVVGIILPFAKPHQYVAYDPTDPMPPNPSQTASWLSLALFSYLDPTVWLAYTAPHLSLTDLPPLADSDHAKNIIRSAFRHLDPFAEVNIGGGKGSTPRSGRRPPRSIFRAVAAVFHKEIVTAICLLLLNNFAGLMSPYGLKKLLEYLEHEGDAATVRPWVWIATLFLAPFTGTLIMQQYRGIVVRSTVHLEAILTQLILQHALRIRIVAEGKPDPAVITGTSTVAASIAESTSRAGSRASSPAPQSETTTIAPEPESSPINTDPDASKSLVGRMNNLISSDLQAITKAAEFLQLFFAAPIMVVLCVAFLYTILGWSALVGFVVMMALMPMPIALSKLLQGAAKEVSKKGDDRVETVTEIVSVIRMVKMFGWEKKMTDRIDEKRDIELSWVWWNKIYSLLTMNF